MIVETKVEFSEEEKPNTKYLDIIRTKDNRAILLLLHPRYGRPIVFGRTLARCILECQDNIEEFLDRYDELELEVPLRKPKEKKKRNTYCFPEVGASKNE